MTRVYIFFKKICEHVLRKGLNRSEIRYKKLCIFVTGVRTHLTHLVYVYATAQFSPLQLSGLASVSSGDEVLCDAVAVDSAKCSWTVVDDVSVQRYDTADQRARLRSLAVLPVHRLHNVPRSRIQRTIQVCKQVRPPARHTRPPAHLSHVITGQL